MENNLFKTFLQKNKRQEVENPEMLNGSKVLVVEDNSINQFMASAVLVKAGFVVEVAANGKIALEMLEKSDFDLVLMDIRMPVMDGYEATKNIRKFPAPLNQIPVIALTVYLDEEESESFIEAGMDDYISKPLEMPVLLPKAYERILKYKEEKNSTGGYSISPQPNVS